LLVEDHADEEGERIVDEVLVRLGITSEREALRDLRGSRHARECRARP
jgi:hypothetical protein